MAEVRPNLRIELGAVKTAVAWSERFEIELRAAALEVAAGTDFITLDHYRKGAPTAVARLLQAIIAHPLELIDAERRVA